MSAIRKLYPAEADLLRTHLKRLDEEARRWRFGQPLTDEAIDRLVDDIDWLNSLHLGYFVDGTLRGSAQLVWKPWHWRDGAEFAVAIETPYQDHGVGTELLRRAASVARNRGIGQLQLFCQGGNRRMLKVALKFGAKLEAQSGEVEGIVPLGGPSQASLFDEALGESAAWLNQWLGQIRLPALLGPAFAPRPAAQDEPDAA
ncbi:MAG: GNAT family N-acetyltransferase [Candidatus Eiseniibacteriota bacterium]